jgi:hypothetical protein
MKNHCSDFCRRFLPAVLFILLIVTSQAKAQTSFQLIWAMDGDLSGSTSNSNFIPSNATLTGAHPHSLPTVLFYALGGGNYAFGTTYWQAAAGVKKYLEFSYSVTTFEYDIASVSFRVRRSGDGPMNVSLRSSLDGFTSNLSVTNLSTEGIFYNVTVPFTHNNLSEGIAFRLYPTDASSYKGVLYFDHVVINGTITSIILPVQLTYLKARTIEKTVSLSWETATEHNSKEFVVERGQDLHAFLPVGKVQGSGESASRVQYSFHDITPMAGVNYYRLRMVDLDQSYAFSHPVDAVIHTDTPAFLISPNPGNANMIRVKTDLAEPQDYILTNILGQTIPLVYIMKDGNYINLIPNHALSSGIYVLSLKLDDRWHYQKLLVP